MKTYKGKFKPHNPKKYTGDITNIIYRSRWELRFMSYLDKHPEVIQWSSEELYITYLSPATRKLQRYFPDFLVKIKQKKTGVISTWVYEIKPFAQTQPPKITKGKRKARILYEQATYDVNQAKWAAATEWCNAHGVKFKILTEHNLNL